MRSAHTQLHNVIVSRLAGINVYKQANIVSELEQSMLDKSAIPRGFRSGPARRKRHRGTQTVNWAKSYNIDTSNVGSGGFGGQGAKMAGLLSLGGRLLGRLASKGVGKAVASTVGKGVGKAVTGAAASKPASSLIGGAAKVLAKNKYVRGGALGVSALSVPLGVSTDVNTMFKGYRG